MPLDRIGKYEVVEVLGSGGMGRVYLAKDPDIGRRVAIKVMTAGEASTEQRFRNEARMAGRLSHPNIVLVHDFGFHEGDPFLVMECLQGMSLDRWLKEPRPLRAVLVVMSGLCRAISYAHAAGVLHRDIKPANVQVLPDGTCKLMDFGIARSLGGASTASGTVAGTPVYMAPEILKDAAYSAKSDLYSVGMVFYEMLAGHNPFAAQTLEACLTKVLTLKPPHLAEGCPDLPLQLLDAVMELVRKNPRKRPGDLEAVSSAIEGLLAVTPDDAGEASIPTVAESSVRDSLRLLWLRRRRRLLGAAAVALLVGAGAAGIAVLRQSPEPPSATPRPAPLATSSPRVAPSRAALPSPVVRPVVRSPAPPAPTPSRAMPGAPATPPAERAAASPTTVRPESPEIPAKRRPSPRPEPAAEVAALVASPPARRVEEAPAPPPLAAPTPVVTQALPSPAVSAAEKTPSLRELIPRTVRRGKTTRVTLHGEHLAAGVVPVVRRGRKATTEVEVLRTTVVDGGRMDVTLIVDEDAPLGSYTVVLVAPSGGASNGLNLDVDL